MSIEKRNTDNHDQDNRIVHLKQMLDYLTKDEQISLEKCASALMEELATKEKLGNKCVLVAYSGGKDSSYMVAYVRLVQLLLFKKTGDTFRMRVCTYRHPGVPQAAMENIHRVYSALRLYNDPYVEMLLFDEEEVSSFDKDKPAPIFARDRNKRDVLMVGHLTHGEGRPIFCNACNISYVRSLVSAAGFNHSNADIFITGDSTREMRDYCKWVRRLAKQIINDPVNIDTKFRGFRGYQAVLEISQYYFKEIYGDRYEQRIGQEANLYDETNCEPQFFSIYEYTNYASGDHWSFLTEYLGFEFDDLAFSFTESDCANPALMAHIRGLKAEHVHQRNYEDGILDYLQLAIKRMKAKELPDHLILKAITRYLSDPGMQAMRNKIQQFTEKAYALSEKQLVCMVFSPFCDQGSRLELFLEREHHDLCQHVSEIHHLLSGREITSAQHIYVEELSEISGLEFADLCVLYQSQSSLTNNGETIIKKILRDDPNKLVIETRHSAHGPIVKELISGR
jgi:hypothetical protein